MTRTRVSRCRACAGFTLTELALSLLIVAILLAGMLVPLSTQIDLRNQTQTQQTLTDIREALLGFAVANGRLPCPASATSNGIESPSGGGNCTNPYDGLLPAATLGITPVDNQGYALDAWQQRLRYAVTVANGNAFTTTNGMKTVTLAALSPNLKICSSAAGMNNAGTAAVTCAAASTLSNSSVAVVYSLGRSGVVGGSGADERHNPNPNTVVAADPAFVSHEPTAANAPQGEFDDVVTWLSPNVLYSRLIAAGQLP